MPRPKRSKEPHDKIGKDLRDDREKREEVERIMKLYMDSPEPRSMVCPLCAGDLERVRSPPDEHGTSFTKLVCSKCGRTVI